jgi:hypothetical protein
MAFIWALASDRLFWIGATSALPAHMPNVAELPQAALFVAPTTKVRRGTACTGIVNRNMARLHSLHSLPSLHSLVSLHRNRDMAIGAALAVVGDAAKVTRITCPMVAAVTVATGAVCVDRGRSRAAKTWLATLVIAAKIAKQAMSVASACTCASTAISCDGRCWIVHVALNAWTAQRTPAAELANHTVLMVAELVT